MAKHEFRHPMDYGYLYKGGYIACMNAEKTPGIVISERNLGKAPWTPGNRFATETFATSNSDGMANTNQIINRSEVAPNSMLLFYVKTIEVAAFRTGTCHQLTNFHY